jgi:hypothetical protein
LAGAAFSGELDREADTGIDTRVVQRGEDLPILRLGVSRTS